jgi:class 3 adenylate cyclase
MFSDHEAPITLEKWAGSQNLNLTLVFTDIVDSTTIGRKLGDRRWIEDLFRHFSRARELASQYDCYVVKVIGDSLMMAFRTSTEAVDFALDFVCDTGVDYIGIRAGINSGQVQIRENDIYGLNVNFTSRIQHAVKSEGILVSESVKRDYEKTFGMDSGVRFNPQEKDLQSFGLETVYWTFRPGSRLAITKQRTARVDLLAGR